MHTRRLLAGVVAASAALLTACGSSDSSSSATDNPPSSAAADKGTVRISGQNFTEAEIVADMYAAVLQKAGYDPQVKLVDTRDVYMKDLPEERRRGAGVHRRDRGVPQRHATTAPTPSRSRSPTRQKTIDKAKPLLDEAGITLLDPSAATDTNAFFVSKDYSEQNNVTTLSDLEGQVGRAGRGARLQGSARLRGWSVVGVRHRHHQDPAAGLRQPADLRVGASTASPSSARPAPPTARSRARVWCCCADDQQIQPAQNLVPMVVLGASSRTTRTWPTR